MLTRNRAAACIVVIVGMFLAAALNASDHEKSYVTINGPVALPNAVLPAGSYTFEFVDPSNAHDVVRVVSRDRSKTFYMGITLPVERPTGMKSGATLTLGEAPRGTPPPVKAWFPSHSSTGREFIY
jgi:hypothetical protein